MMRAARTADEDGITAMVVDTVTGRVLHQQHHAHACGPVAASLFDNQAVVQFWDMKASRWHMASMELYEHGTPLPSTVKMIAGM